MPPLDPSGGAWLARVWSVAGSLAEPALRLVLARRARIGKEITERLQERRGIEGEARPAGRLLWMHAASVGETISVLPVLHALARAAPDIALLLTTGTVTSASIAAERLPAGARHRFVPLDVPRWVGRFLDHWRPDLVCLVESELWPNILAAAAARKLPLALVNGRLSARSLRQWRHVPGLARRLMQSFDLIWARSADDAARFTRLGALGVLSPGDLKFAAPPLPADNCALAELSTLVAGCPVWTASSLHPGEEVFVAAAHELLRVQHRELVTIVVPRHPRRAAEMLARHPMPRRSHGEPPVPGGMYMADTLGELGMFYRVGCCAFVGGSLVAHGGQNPLEPARLGRPVAVGPHMENFAEAHAVLGEAGALVEVANAAALAGFVHRMLSDPSACAAAGEAGGMAAQRWADLPDRSARALIGLMRPPP